MTEEIRKKIEEIKTLCEDRLDAKTAEGNVLGKVFAELLAMPIAKEKK